MNSRLDDVGPQEAVRRILRLEETLDRITADVRAMQLQFAVQSGQSGIFKYAATGAVALGAAVAGAAIEHVLGIGH